MWTCLLITLLTQPLLPCPIPQTEGSLTTQALRIQWIEAVAQCLQLNREQRTDIQEVQEEFWALRQERLPQLQTLRENVILLAHDHRIEHKAPMPEPLSQALRLLDAAQQQEVRLARIAVARIRQCLSQEQRKALDQLEITFMVDQRWVQQLVYFLEELFTGLTYCDASTDQWDQQWQHIQMALDPVLDSLPLPETIAAELAYWRAFAEAEGLSPLSELAHLRVCSHPFLTARWLIQAFVQNLGMQLTPEQVTTWLEQPLKTPFAPLLREWMSHAALLSPHFYCFLQSKESEDSSAESRVNPGIRPAR
jgi:hypothetical protein